MLDRFDDILAAFVKAYKLDEGPQRQPFDQRVLLDGMHASGVDSLTATAGHLTSFGPDADRQLIESILAFSYLLFQKCGNRSLYSSSEHINHILNTTSLSLLKAALDFSLCLAERCYSSRIRSANPHLLASVLANHYNLSLSNLMTLATPFRTRADSDVIPGLGSSKSKKRPHTSEGTTNASNISALVSQDTATSDLRHEFSEVSLTYPDTSTTSLTPALPSSETFNASAGPSTPTPMRNVTQTPLTGSKEKFEERTNTPKRKDNSARVKNHRVSDQEISQKTSWEILERYIPETAAEYHYTFLHRLRICEAFRGNRESVELLVAIRMLAIANLAYVYGDSMFYQKLGRADSELPREYQVIQQLTNILQPTTDESSTISMSMTTCALRTLTALSKCRAKFLEVSSALNTSVSHGIFFYIMKKLYTSISSGTESPEEEAWRMAVFELADIISASHTHQRVPEQLVQAGFINVLVEMLDCANPVALRHHPTVIKFFDNFVYNGVREAFESLVEAHGLDKIAQLTATTVQSALQSVQHGNGIPAQFRTKIMDYHAPFFEQQTLRLSFKFVGHLFHHSIGSQDRSLRNLIDSSSVLEALKAVILNAHSFGSHVWSGALNIITSFIYNEPTSYSVISEASLDRAILDSVSHAATMPSTNASVSGVLPVAETMKDIPAAFGAICLHESGMKLFTESDALSVYFNLFTSAEHVKALEHGDPAGMAATIGKSIDELVRHYPGLKDTVTKCIRTMLRQVIVACSARAGEVGVGAKLWVGQGEDAVIAGGRASLAGLSPQRAADIRHDQIFDYAQPAIADTTAKMSKLKPADSVSVERAEADSTEDMISAACKFLRGYFHHGNNASRFCQDGNAEIVLDFCSLPSSHFNLHDRPVFSELSKTIELLVDCKPHLVLPSIVRKVQDHLHILRPLIEHKGQLAFFEPFTNALSANSSQSQALSAVNNGTYTVKSLVTVQVLCNILANNLSMPPSTTMHRSSHMSLFKQVNLTDVYDEVVEVLGRLHSICIKEEIAMQKAMSIAWSKKTRVHGHTFENAEVDHVMGDIQDDANDEHHRNALTGSAVHETSANDPEASALLDPAHSGTLQNTETLRYLMSQTPISVATFFQALARSLLPKRTLDAFHKQCADRIAERLAEAAISQLKSVSLIPASQPDDRLAFETVVLSSTTRILLEKRPKGALQASIVNTLVLQKFYALDGFELLNDCLSTHCEHLLQLYQQGEQSTSHGAINVLRAAINLILDLYHRITPSKALEDSLQSRAMDAGGSDNPAHASYYNPSQFTVELRAVILKSVSTLWLQYAEKLDGQSVKLLISILKDIFAASGEALALKRSNTAKRVKRTDVPKFDIHDNNDLLDLVRSDMPASNSIEALFRCNSDNTAAHEYSALHRLEQEPGSRIPWIPVADVEIGTIATAPDSSDDGSAAGDSQPPANVMDTDPAHPITNVTSSAAVENSSSAVPATSSTEANANNAASRRLPADILSDGLSELLRNHSDGGAEFLMSTNMPSHRRASKAAHQASEEVEQVGKPYVTIEDLEEDRQTVKSDLIDRCLAILAEHDLSFDLAELIISATRGESDETMADVVRTLIQVLVSLRPDDGGLPEDADRVASCAHLLGLILQEADYFVHAEIDLGQNLRDLIGFLRLRPEDSLDNAKFIGYVLSITERVLAEDESPDRAPQWPPRLLADTEHGPSKDDAPELLGLIVSEDDRELLFGLLIDLLPRIGKLDSLALSVTRMLVVLTRRRSLVKKMCDKETMGKLFLMMKQLAGHINERLQGAFLILLRHLVEDDDIVRQIMRTEIKKAFQIIKSSSRNMDGTAYIRTLYHLVLRDPEMFAVVTSELVQLSRYDGSGTHQSQAMCLKDDADSSVQPATSVVDKAPAPELASESKADKTPSKTRPEPATAQASSYNGVVKYLLKELTAFKDVEDVEPKDEPSQADTSRDADVEMTGTTPAPLPESRSPTAIASTSKSSKPVFKAEHHPFFMYRCFLLQCLAEVLASYSRTKLDFIYFGPKPEHYAAATPSKPRSGVLNYLLSTLIPVGTLVHSEDIAYRKKLATSNWAISVIVALCQKTSEYSADASSSEEPTPDDADLTFVRRFVLEHALKTFRDAISSTEPEERRYSRLQSLGDLFYRMLQAKGSQDSLVASQKQLGRLMYEKNFVSTLTAAIAEIELEHLNAKRAVKYLLRPLKALTEIIVDLSTSSDSPLLGNDEDEISSATSVSEHEHEDDGREATPDLFRHSTLGQFESRVEEDATDSESGSHDDDDGEEGDEEYDDEYAEYDEEVDYEEEAEHDHGDVVSDDEDMGSMGEIEGLPGNMNRDMEIVMDEDGDTATEDDEDEEHDHDEDDEHDLDHEHDEHDHHHDHDHDEYDGDSQDDDGDDEQGDEWEDEIADEEGHIHHIQGQGMHGTPFDTMVSVLDGDSALIERLERGQTGAMEIEIEGPNHAFSELVVQNDGDDMDEAEQAEDDMMYEPEMDHDDDDGPALDWSWNEQVQNDLARNHDHRHHNHNHNHNHAHGGVAPLPFDVWDFNAGRPAQMASNSGYRVHRGGAVARGMDDGTNPLLQRDPASVPQDASAQRFIDTAWAPQGRRSGLGELPTFVSEMIDMIGPQAQGMVAGNGGHGMSMAMAPVVITAGPDGSFRQMPGIANLPAILRRGMHQMQSSSVPDTQTYGRPSGSDPGQAINFLPKRTIERWQEEARLLHGRIPQPDVKAGSIIGYLLSILTPPALEAKRKRDILDAERKAVEEVEREAQLKDEAERRDREEKERKAREEVQAQEAAESAQRAQQAATQDITEAPVAMQGIDQAQSEVHTAPVAPAETIMVNIRGREVNIANLGIDRDYIEALPEEMREEVVMQQYVDQREAAAGSGQPSNNELDRDFLAALPPDIQAELVRSETILRQRRERDEARSRAAASGNAAPAQVEEMNNADFMAMLDPALRQSVLMEADDNFLASLPYEFQAEARALMGGRRTQRHAAPRPARQSDAQAMPDPAESTRIRRPVVQILDKHGVATLLRLMFVTLQGTARTAMFGVLSDACKNTQNRAEVISILLAILQDGSADSVALKKSYTSLTYKSKPNAGTKTPQPAKRSGNEGATTTPDDISPTMILQHCLSTLLSLTQNNPRVSSFFVSEHETMASQRNKNAKKGKNKESKASKYPLNALLSILDRPAVLENAMLVENVTALLVRVTEPIKILSRRMKETEKTEEQQKGNADSAPAAAGNEQTQVASSSTEQAPDAHTGAATIIQDVTMSGTEPLAGTDIVASVETAPVKSAETAERKKARQLSLPEVPEEQLRSVINVLAARECPSKTFGHALEIINHLSVLANAREVFGAELVQRAKLLAEDVLTDLRQLPRSIESAKNSTDIQGVTLTRFSPSSSHQNKLLRMLVVLDYIYDVRRSSSESAGDAARQSQKEGLVSTLYESQTFIKLWDLLSECLTALRIRGSMNNIATILQPLIESFMVVCKNTSSLSNPQETGVNGTPAPESQIGKLFNKFTEEHRKILNDLVRHNPKLMSGTFDVLVKNPKVLEFDNKRSYFSKKLRTRDRNDQRPSNTLLLNIRRDEILEDSFKGLSFKKPAEIKYGKLNIRFRGEEGVDAGGVTREWFAALTRKMFNLDIGLWDPVASDKTTFHPSHNSEHNGEFHLAYFKFIGRIIGKALYEGRVLDCHFSRAVYKSILGKSTSLKDMESIDLEYYKSLCWLLENDITDVTFETFSVDLDILGATRVVDLIPDGRNIQVTERNKELYVQKVVEQRLTKTVEQQLGQFLLGMYSDTDRLEIRANIMTGFHEIVPAELIAVFDENELELLISGLPDIDVEDWKNNTTYQNYSASSPQTQWFWRAVRSFDKEERAKLLQFVTGTSKVPLNGFKELEGMNGFSKFSIHRDFGSADRLPSSHTCFNRESTLVSAGYEQDTNIAQSLIFQHMKHTRRCESRYTPP